MNYISRIPKTVNKKLCWNNITIFCTYQIVWRNFFWFSGKDNYNLNYSN